MSPEDRFWARVDRTAGPDSCWPWTGQINPKGYGVLAVFVGQEHNHDGAPVRQGDRSRRRSRQGRPHRPCAECRSAGSANSRRARLVKAVAS